MPLCKKRGSTAILIKDIATVQAGRAERRGILDINGTEAVGGIVTIQKNYNPKEVIKRIHEKIEVLSGALPCHKQSDGNTSCLHIVPFYDRSTLIDENLSTLRKTLLLEVLITLLVFTLFLRFHRVAGALLILLPLAMFLVFIAMYLFRIQANIAALAGIAIGVGTLLDMGIILIENIHSNYENTTTHIKKHVLQYSTEVMPAILSATATTVVGFLPIFCATGNRRKNLSSYWSDKNHCPAICFYNYALYSPSGYTYSIPLATAAFSKAVLQKFFFGQ